MNSFLNLSTNAIKTADSLIKHAKEETYDEVEDSIKSLRKNFKAGNYLAISTFFIIFGISTWDFGELQEDWESHWEEVHGLDLSGKTIALFGLGDQLGYGEWFQDALGMLHDAILPSGCKIVGYWPNEGYEFTASKALTEDKTQFVGLSLDDENQYDKTDARIEAWCEQLLVSMA